MTGHDQLMDSVRRARPDERLSARTPAAQALLEEILSMQTSPAQVAADGRPDVVVRPHRSRRLRLALGSVAAAALALAVVVGAPGEPSRADAVEAAIARSSSLLDRSGRAEITDHWTWDSGDGVDSDAQWAFSGDDSEATFDTQIGGQRVGCVHPDDPPCTVLPMARHVGGKFFLYTRDQSGGMTWFRLSDLEGRDRGFGLDPSTVLGQLQPAGGFEEVGQEDVDGVPTTRFRAKDPAATPVPDIRGQVWGDTVTALEVWLDGDGLVRRLDIATVRTAPPDAGELIWIRSYS